eukprot:scaffold1395_cov397-Prasinococcus_capsulatus_cf.AAC.3
MTATRLWRLDIEHAEEYLGDISPPNVPKAAFQSRCERGAELILSPAASSSRSRTDHRTTKPFTVLPGQLRWRHSTAGTF